MKNTFWDKMAKRYDDDIKKHDSRYEKSVYRTKSLLSRSDVVLDFACASGEYSLDIAPHVRRVHGIDISSEMIKYAGQKARDRHMPNASFSQTDVFDEALESSAYSAIIAFNVFHLIDDIPKALARLHELLEPGGVMVSQTPCLGECGWFLRGLFSVAKRMGFFPSLGFLKAAELESLVSSSKFSISETMLWQQKGMVQWIVARKA